jgi:hypothetical protein
MKTGIALILFAMIQFGTAPKEQSRWIDIFDGESLNGWTLLNGTALYRVEDSAIVGRTTKGSPNSFLCSDKDYGDFELEFEVRVDDDLNSGIQIRSRQLTKEDLKNIPEVFGGKKLNQPVGRYGGPQIEIAAKTRVSGYVYGEAMGTGWLSKEPQSDNPQAGHGHFIRGAWNAYRIIAKGSRIQTYINGHAVEDLDSENAYKTHPSGSIGLQVHSISRDSGPYEVRWRKIRIKEL